jgi:hypothetical protein
MIHVRIQVTLFLLLAVRAVAAQQLDQFEKILLPVEPVFYLRGVDRSYSSSVIYASSHPIRYYPASDLLGKPLGIGELTPSIGDNLKITTNLSTNGAGRFLFVEKGAFDDMELTLNLYTGDRSSGALTPVPVVRESQFRTGKLVLPGIRLTRAIGCVYINTLCSTLSADRLKVYVYDAGGTGNDQVLVRIWRGQQVMQETVVSMNQRNGSDPSYPYYGTLEYRWTYNGSEYPSASDTFSVELQPLQEHARYWAFAIVIPTYGGGPVFSPRP